METASRFFSVASPCFLFLSLSVRAGASSIPPKPLWDLITESERIVVARVERIEKEPKGDFAVLRVIEAWKGPFSDTIRVDLQREMLWAPRYLEEREALAFLRRPRWRGSVGDVWETVGYSYGVIYPEVEERQGLFDLVQRIPIETFPLGPEFEKDWHVEAAIRRSTRWHGLDGLLPHVNEVNRFGVPSGRADLFRLLSREDQQRIAHGFLTDPSDDATFPMTLEVLHGFKSAEIDTIAVALVEGLLLGSRPPWTAQSIETVLKRFGNSESLGRLWFPNEPEQVFALLSKGHYDGRLREFWASAAGKLGIPFVEPLVLEEYR